MTLLYEQIYRRKQDQYKRDGDLQSFNSFIAKAHEMQYAVATKAIPETEYNNWLNSQMAS